MRHPYAPRPRYTVDSVNELDSAAILRDSHTGHGTMRYGHSDAYHLAQWLNERAKGYPSQIKLADDCPRHRPDLIRAELLQLRAQSTANWRERAERRYYASQSIKPVKS